MAEVIVSQVPENKGESSVEEKFQAALSVIKSLPKNGSYKPSPEMMLRFYSYYKQAMEGPCTKPKPWAWDVINKAKWEAWNKLGDMPKASAMDNYVESLKEIVESMPVTEEVESFVKVLGNFYEVIQLEPPKEFKKYRAKTSTPLKDTPIMNGNGAVHRQLNGHSVHEQSTIKSNKLNGDLVKGNPEAEKNELEDSSDEDDELHQPTANGNFSNEADDDQSQDLSGPSDSEDEFCDTAEHVQLAAAANLHSLESPNSPTHGFTLLDENGERRSSDRSETLSTLDETFSGEKYSGDVSLESRPEILQTIQPDLVKIRTCGGEYGARGADNQKSATRNAGLRRGGHGPRNHDDPSSVGRRHPAGGGAGGSGAPNYTYSEVQDQIANTLFQLQQDMNSVLNRLTILEALTVEQQARRGRTVSSGSNSSGNISRHTHRAPMPSWWPFPDLSPKTALFIIFWPFIAKWLIQLIRKRHHFRR